MMATSRTVVTAVRASAAQSITQRTAHSCAFSTATTAHSLSRSAAKFNLSSLSASLPQISHSSNTNTRSIHTTTAVQADPAKSALLTGINSGLAQFFHNQQVGPVGESWTATQCRVKSAVDLQKLWFVLLKERNMLATYKHNCFLYKITPMFIDRVNKVKVSMRAIKQTLGERQREYRTAINDTTYLKQQTKAVTHRQLVKAWSRNVLVKRAHAQRTHANIAPGSIKEKNRRRKKIRSYLMKPRAAEEEAVVEQ